MLSTLGRAVAIHLERAVVDSASVRAVFGGAHTGPNPTDRAKAGCKRQVLADAQGLPLIVKTTPANTRDDQVALPLLIDMPPTPGPRGRPRSKPKVLQGDAGYGTASLMLLVKAMGIHAVGPARQHPTSRQRPRRRNIIERLIGRL